MRDAAISRVESGLTVLADLARLLIAAEKEDAVVCPGRNSKGYQQINGKRGEPDQSVISEERDNPSGRGQFDANHDQQEKHRDDGAVDQQQHGDDHQKSYNSHLEEGFVATMVHVLHERRRAGHIRGYTFWRGCAVHDTANSIHRFVSQGRTLVTGEIYLNVYAFTVGALRGRRRERIAPKILDVLHVLRIVFQLTNHAVVVPVRVVAEFLLAFQDDHRETVGIRFLEFLAHNFHRVHRRRIFRAQRHRTLLRDLLQRWNGGTNQENDRQPRQDDGNRQPMDRPRHEWRSGVLGAPLLVNHAPFSTQ